MKSNPQPLHNELRPLPAAILVGSDDGKPLAHFLTEHSGLPGPRLNPALVAAFAARVGELGAEPEPPARLTALLRKTVPGGADSLALQAAATAWYAAQPAVRHSKAGFTLRQALGFTWSVTVAAAPDRGFPTLSAPAAGGDADLRWIVPENAKKNRPAAMIAALP